VIRPSVSRPTGMVTPFDRRRRRTRGLLSRESATRVRHREADSARRTDGRSGSIAPIDTRNGGSRLIEAAHGRIGARFRGVVAASTVVWSVVRDGAVPDSDSGYGPGSGQYLYTEVPDEGDSVPVGVRDRREADVVLRSLDRSGSEASS
jgi:hypothetical protein